MVNTRLVLSCRCSAAIVSFSLAWSGSLLAAGDPAQGATQFRACTACHSTIPGEHLTGPSLANVYQRKAGTVEGFGRYSEAMKGANVTWTAQTLERWLTNVADVVPGTSMTFPGLRDGTARADVIAYLKAVAEGAAPRSPQGADRMMRGRPARMNLKEAPPEGRVIAVSHCKDAYTVKTADGKVETVWEFNLRFKSDSSALGPEQGKPVIVGAGMQGDRASVVFATPDEISSFIKKSCP